MVMSLSSAEKIRIFEMLAFVRIQTAEANSGKYYVAVIADVFAGFSLSVIFIHALV